MKFAFFLVMGLVLIIGSTMQYYNGFANSFWMHSLVFVGCAMIYEGVKEAMR